ncbi:MAG: tRNA (adenosine(37)-N6)-dimethylallyltransferase MiaA [Bdellovibrio sp.]|nr:MAG: tRNA (adenosine(37)-N6)-dimethylallyltransferase MiaA [Bdellovibrio sp.]
MKQTAAKTMEQTAAPGMKHDRSRVIFLVGATGTGKSRVAVSLAKRWGGAICNADSIQLYRRLDVGSAKPSPAERALCPHFLFDLIEPPQVATVGDYHRIFFAKMKEIEDQYPVVIVVGGTGFYFQALEKGLWPIPPANEQMQKEFYRRIEAGQAPQLHEELQQLDPPSAARIHVHDHYRLVRALDIIHSTGKPLTQILSDHQKSGSHFAYPLLKIALKSTPEELASSIRARTDEMLKKGLLHEVQGLVSEGFAKWEPLQSVGYKQCLGFLERRQPGAGDNSDGTDDSDGMADVDGAEVNLGLAELQKEIVKETLKLAKKQRTWFQRDKEIRWFHPAEISAMEDLVSTFLL